MTDIQQATTTKTNADPPFPPNPYHSTSKTLCSLCPTSSFCPLPTPALHCSLIRPILSSRSIPS